MQDARVWKLFFLYVVRRAMTSKLSSSGCWKVFRKEAIHSKRSGWRKWCILWGMIFPTSALLATAIMAWPWNGPTCSCLNNGFSACGMSLLSYRSFKKWSRMAKVDHWGQVLEWRNPTPDSTPYGSPVVCAFPTTTLPRGLVSLPCCHYYDGPKLWKPWVKVNLSSFMFLWGARVMVM